MVGQGTHEKGLPVGEQAVRLGTVKGQAAHGLARVSDVHLHAVVDVIIQIDFPVAGGGKPVVSRQDFAVPHHHGLWRMAEPDAVRLVNLPQPGPLCRLKLPGLTKRVPVDKLLGLRVHLNGEKAGIGVGDHQLQLSQQRRLQLLHGPAGVEPVEHLIVQQKVIGFHGQISPCASSFPF